MSGAPWPFFSANPIVEIIILGIIIGSLGYGFLMLVKGFIALTKTLGLLKAFALWVLS